MIFDYSKISIDGNKIIPFLIIYFSIVSFFYFILDFIVRYILHKKIKDKVLKEGRRIRDQHRTELLKEMSDFRRKSVNFVIEYPIGLGYVDQSEFKQMDIETPNQNEKDEAINKVVAAATRWSCTFIHLLVTLIFVFKYYPWLMTLFLIFGALLALVVISTIILLVDNIEIVTSIANHLSKKVSGSKVNNV